MSWFTRMCPWMGGTVVVGRNSRYRNRNHRSPHSGDDEAASGPEKRWLGRGEDEEDREEEEEKEESQREEWSEERKAQLKFYGEDVQRNFTPTETKELGKKFRKNEKELDKLLTKLEKDIQKNVARERAIASELHEYRQAIHDPQVVKSDKDYLEAQMSALMADLIRVEKDRSVLRDYSSQIKSALSSSHQAETMMRLQNVMDSVNKTMAQAFQAPNFHEFEKNTAHSKFTPLGQHAQMADSMREMYGSIAKDNKGTNSLNQDISLDHRADPQVKARLKDFLTMDAAHDAQAHAVTYLKDLPTVSANRKSLVAQQAVGNDKGQGDGASSSTGVVRVDTASSRGLRPGTMRLLQGEPKKPPVLAPPPPKTRPAKKKHTPVPEDEPVGKVELPTLDTLF